MQNRNPTTPSECKEALMFLNYLRKSHCKTPGTAWATPGCRTAMADMQKVAKECIEISNNNFNP